MAHELARFLPAELLQPRQIELGEAVAAGEGVVSRDEEVEGVGERAVEIEDGQLVNHSPGSRTTLARIAKGRYRRIPMVRWIRDENGALMGCVRVRGPVNGYLCRPTARTDRVLLLRASRADAASPDPVCGDTFAARFIDGEILDRLRGRA